MAAAVLIAILIITMMLYVFRQGAQLNMSYDSGFYAKNVAKFNAKIESLITRNHNNAILLSGEGTRQQYTLRNYSSADEVISVINLAYDYNTKAENDVTNQIIVEVVKKSGTRIAKIEVDSTGDELEPGLMYGIDNNTTISYADFIKDYGNSYIEPYARDFIVGKIPSYASNLELKEVNPQNNYIYQYVFKGDLTYDEVNLTEDGTGKIKKITFTLLENQLYKYIEEAKAII